MASEGMTSEDNVVEVATTTTGVVYTVGFKVLFDFRLSEAEAHAFGMVNKISVRCVVAGMGGWVSVDLGNVTFDGFGGHKKNAAQLQASQVLQVALFRNAL